MRIDDKDSSDCESDSFLLGEGIEVVLRYHVVEECDFAIGVGDDGKLDRGGTDFVDVGDPLVVRGEVVRALSQTLEYLAHKTLDGITYKANHLDTALLKLILQLRERA